MDPFRSSEDEMTDSFDYVKFVREHGDKAAIPGGLLTKQGKQDYVGAVPAVTGTLFFKDAHTRAVRDAICECFEEYEAIAKQHLTWLWREEPPEGPDKMAYPKAAPLREMMKRMNENDLVSFYYVSGKQPHDSGAWEFQVVGRRGWQAKLKSAGFSSLRFSVPPLYLHQNPRAFQQMFVNFARRLKAEHGYGGNALVRSVVRDVDNEPVEAYMAEKLNALDVGTPFGVSRAVVGGIKTVSWLTAINNDMVEKVGGLSRIRSELPGGWFAVYDYGNGVVIQAGPQPEIAPVDQNPKPAIYVLPNMLLKDVRVPQIGSLHGPSLDGEPRIRGQAAEDWLRRFDVSEEELLPYKAKLLDEPKLSTETMLPDRL
ncbi:DUF3396 domain-containing protein [Aquabacterium sp. A7-Y]|uniref:type VI immunity family protein n=1 Tax=Aquabacterium sp. A7-Y TaxID=1349605 RepID=UPI00223E3B9B|nr:type VI immunity family protein [Aquabacterium sp. A7-Y]MCW7538248.1 DUF3396 domain-containing protein [Aquabacterium sp. A7-Y]